MIMSGTQTSYSRFLLVLFFGGLLGSDNVINQGPRPPRRQRERERGGIEIERERERNSHRKGMQNANKAKIC